MKIAKILIYRNELDMPEQTFYCSVAPAYLVVWLLTIPHSNPGLAFNSAY
jgi:hypothetical protein